MMSDKVCDVIRNVTKQLLDVIVVETDDVADGINHVMFAVSTICSTFALATDQPGIDAHILKLARQFVDSPDAQRCKAQWATTVMLDDVIHKSKEGSDGKGSD